MPPRPDHDNAGPGRLPGVLVVDDEPYVRRLLEAALVPHGFAVWTAAGGEEAVATFRLHADAIDVALLDVRMCGMDGPATLLALRRVGPHLCFCFMTGYAGDHGREALLCLGAAAVFDKPFDLGEAEETLRSLARERGGQRAVTTPAG